MQTLKAPAARGTPCDTCDTMYCEDLLQHDQKGTGILLMWKKKFVFAVSKRSFWDRTGLPWTIPYTNVGGTVEPGERVIDAARREALEEMNCEVELLPSPETLACFLGGPPVTHHQLDDECPPLLIYNTPGLSVCVYCARTTSAPVPCREVPALLLLPPSRVGGGLLHELLESGKIREQVTGSIPRNAVASPWGSADLLSRLYDELNSIAHFDSWQ